MQALYPNTDIGWHNWWPRFYNADAVKWFATDWNCNVLRAATGVEPDDAYLSKPEWSEKLICDVVDAAIANDIYVIIDWHSHNIRLEDAKAFFKKWPKNMGSIPMLSTKFLMNLNAKAGQT